ncbi:MAG: hypothetical protein UY47_C0012G0004 [Parcubacteria group bacterium GW2011_GWB1_49_7]|nr:MAG: hypothetical protein UY47_C0012G0004 [Parcubacteria group bacterium GW2011_GWB1_49_7]
MVKCCTSYYYNMEKPRAIRLLWRRRGATGTGRSLVAQLDPYSQHREQCMEGERLVQERGAELGAHVLERSRIVLRDNPVPAHEDEGNVGGSGTRPNHLEKLDPTPLGHRIVRDYEVELALTEKLPGLPAVAGYHGAVSGVPHDILDREPDPLAVIDYQNSHTKIPLLVWSNFSLSNSILQLIIKVKPAILIPISLRPI